MYRYNSNSNIIKKSWAFSSCPCLQVNDMFPCLILRLLRPKEPINITKRPFLSSLLLTRRWFRNNSYYIPRFQKELMKQFLTVSVPEALLKMEKLYVENNNGKECFLVGEVSFLITSFLESVRSSQKPSYLTAQRSRLGVHDILRLSHTYEGRHPGWSSKTSCFV